MLSFVPFVEVVQFHYEMTTNGILFADFFHEDHKLISL